LLVIFLINRKKILYTNSFRVQSLNYILKLNNLP
jgi:hypothetical protein